jgi:hypothetical protein
MATTIGESVSRVRNVLKSVKEDPFLTDRFIYSLVLKYGKTLMRRDKRLDNLYKNESLFKEIPCIELIDSNPIDACCLNIKTKCSFKRTKDKLPKIEDVGSGPIIKAVTSLDYSVRLKRIHPELYSNLTKTSGFKYNKSIYYWIIGEHMFIPNVEWEAIRIQALFDDDISSYLCSSLTEEDTCRPQQDRTFTIPDHLFSEIEQMVIKEILIGAQLPQDNVDDKQNILR